MEVVASFIKILTKPAINTCSTIFLRQREYLNSGVEWKCWSFMKKGDAINQENYREVALIINITKIFMEMLNNWILEWIEYTCSLSKNQNGFRKGRGCLDKIFTLNILNNIQFHWKSRKVYAIFVDFAKAYDKVN